MFEFVRFVYRNPSYVTRHYRQAWATRKSMRKFREAEEKNGCYWCGRTKRLDVHHDEPVSIAPEKAACHDNMTLLCRRPACHQVIGHDGNFKSRYVENVKKVCKGRILRVVKTISASKRPH